MEQFGFLITALKLIVQILLLLAVSNLLLNERLILAIYRIIISSQPTVILRVLNLVVPPCEQEHVIGDLIEEFNRFPSRLDAYLWLYKQVIKSIVPLLLKTIKNRLVSYFGERIR